MEDGARQHRNEQVFSFPYEYFGERVIELDSPKCTGAGMDWPPYRPISILLTAFCGVD